ncbi:MAG: acetate--CoA ligase family protein [Spirochaetota bacterium]
MDEKRILEVVTKARAEGRDALTEVEGLSLLAAMGVPAPSCQFVKGSSAVDGLAPLPGTKAVVKVISPAILHKTDM